MTTAAMPHPAQSFATMASLAISSASTWMDAIWQFDIGRPGAAASDRTIDWGFQLPDGSRFTDPAWAPLRKTAKAFLISLRNDPPAGRRPLRDSTLVSTFHRMAVLIRWMAAERYECFAAVDAAAAERFLATMRRRAGHRGGTCTVATLRLYIQLLGRLHAQRDKLEDAVADDLGDYLVELAIRYRRSPDRPEPTLPYTPDEVAVALISGAIRLIGQPADDIIALRDLTRSAYVVRSPTCQPLSGFTFATLDGESVPWHRSPLRLTDLIYLIDRLYDACFVVIAYLVGLRVSEILGLEVGCIEFHPDSEGAEPAAYLRGVIYKTAPDPAGKPHRWPAPEPVVRAIAVLERLSEPVRQALARPHLWLTTRDPARPASPIGIPSSAVFIHRLNRAFATFVGLPLHEGKRWHFSTHQGRKTFARFVGKRDRTGLHALQMHFGHVSRIMTDRAYVGTDFELAELIGKEALEETRAALEELLTAPNLAGAAGRMLASRSRFRGRTRDGEVSAYVDFILRDSGMVLGVCDWGYCVYRREHSACQGDEAGPNPAQRTQSVCVRCANFAVTERHRPIWEDRRRRNRALLEHPQLDRESRQLAEQRATECEQILAELDRGAKHAE